MLSLTDLLTGTIIALSISVFRSIKQLQHLYLSVVLVKLPIIKIVAFVYLSLNVFISSFKYFMKFTLNDFEFS